MEERQQSTIATKCRNIVRIQNIIDNNQLSTCYETLVQAYLEENRKPFNSIHLLLTF